MDLQGDSLSSSWNLEPSSATTFYVANLGQIGVEDSNTVSGFIVTGNFLPVVGEVMPTCSNEIAGSVQAAGCYLLSINASPTPGRSWVTNGESYTVYNLIISNAGDSAISSITIGILPSDAESQVSSTWNLNRIGSTNDYIVNLFGNPLAVGQTYTNVYGFIWEGLGSFTITCT